MPERPAKGRGAFWPVLRLATQKFMRIDGPQRAAALAYTGFFALFPVIILFVTAASFFVPREKAAAIVLSYVQSVFPSSSGAQAHVFAAVSGVIQARGRASAVALLILVWVASQFFVTLIQAANRAWGTSGNKWWKLPLKSLALLGIMTVTVLGGIGAPMLARLAAGTLHSRLILPDAYHLALSVAPWGAVFLSVMFFYKLAPHRRTSYSEIWPSALLAALLLNAAQTLFVLYLRHFATLNAVYGAFGGLMALLLWIYISGLIFVFCACLGAAQASFKEQRGA